MMTENCSKTSTDVSLLEYVRWQAGFPWIGGRNYMKNHGIVLKSQITLKICLGVFMLISNAYADTASSSGFSLGSLSSLWPIALMFILVYFLMIRPQRRKQKEQQDMISGLGAGDEVLTSGGIIGKVLRVEEAFLVLEISAGNTMVVQKNAIVSLLPKGSIDAMLNGDPDNQGKSETIEEDAAVPQETQETGKPEDADRSGQSA